MSTSNDSAYQMQTHRAPFLVVGLPIVQNLLPGACLPVQPVVTFPPLLVRWNPNINVALSNTIQMPTTAAGHILKVTTRWEGGTEGRSRGDPCPPSTH